MSEEKLDRAQARSSMPKILSCRTEFNYYYLIHIFKAIYHKCSQCSNTSVKLHMLSNRLQYAETFDMNKYACDPSSIFFDTQESKSIPDRHNFLRKNIHLPCILRNQNRASTERIDLDLRPPYSHFR